MWPVAIHAESKTCWKLKNNICILINTWSIVEILVTVELRNID